MDRASIEKTIFNAIAKINEQQPKDKQLEISSDTIIFGPQSTLDSLSLVELIVEIEQELADDFGVEMTLADEHSMSQTRSPFRSVESLTDYISMRLQEG